jgi:hypothetical protein
MQQAEAVEADRAADPVEHPLAAQAAPLLAAAAVQWAAPWVVARWAQRLARPEWQSPRPPLRPAWPLPTAWLAGIPLAGSGRKE